ncbi:Small nuclear RNA activating complex (SNAPc), subunit SNAP43 [Carex littledalei]|uniref:Small nuclear RNA activating complex (SNAPc), subunit SNAP43 n=1 Tax=Carex littledalei TaxID=544730 RepID=A0A833R5Z0_9POAL|nr:Small nuclear RNA activating complex (SNAPc), subunit SNAP43 [Carex littledalei]
MKRIWKERKFSYIFEAKPTRNSAFFMQSLYTHCISYEANKGADIEVENFKKNLSEYELAKELAIQEASKTADIGDVEHIIEKKKSTGDVMEEIVHKWDAQKNDFYEKTDTNWTDQIAATEDNFDKELENILGE